MDLRTHFELLAEYNQWMNQKVYEAAEKLAPGEVDADRGAFFSSILGTLNHIVVADTIWLRRFMTMPSQEAMRKSLPIWPNPQALNDTVFDRIGPLWAHRQNVDYHIRLWVSAFTEADLSYVLEYSNTKGELKHQVFSVLLLHFFNHQTHHRGQVTTLLNQRGVDLGSTDLISRVPLALP
tara:strand:- start:2678 stop:3217 length:540 start_codon:yes stop_codon:yes gene_type:complete